MRADSLKKLILLLLVKEKRKKPWEESQYKLIIFLSKMYINDSYNEKKRRIRTKWVSRIYTEERRLLQGASENLITEMRLYEEESFYNCLRMTPPVFDKLLSIIGPKISKQHVVRAPIPAKTRLEITLRYLATGDSIHSLGYLFRVSPASVSLILSETCTVLWDTLKLLVFPQLTQNTWKQISADFERKWNFPHCLSAVDGKLVHIQSPWHTGSEYFDYKGHHSVHFLGFADAHCKFTMVDVGAAGRQSDGGVFSASQIGQRLKNNDLNVPLPEPLVPGGVSMPYVLIGDEAFALSNFLMTPYPRSSDLNLVKRVFNYRLCRARRIVEAAFGLQSSIWQVLRTTMKTSLAVSVKVIKATICLHNFVLMYEERRQEDVEKATSAIISNRNGEIGLIDEPNEFTAVGVRSVKAIRDNFAEYFVKEGAVPFQWDKAVHSDF